MSDTPGTGQTNIDVTQLDMPSSDKQVVAAIVARIVEVAKPEKVIKSVTAAYQRGQDV